MIARFFYLIFIRSWWVIGFILICAIFYEHNLQKREHLYQQLLEKNHLLEKEKLASLKIHQNLKKQINSQSDLSWIELTLMKELGVVPEGEHKIYFQSFSDY